MHPEIARRIITKYAKKSDIILDPFMGSGGVLLESILYGNNAIGIDLNPFAVLLAKVKTTPIRKNLTRTFDTILKKSIRDHKNGRNRTNYAPTGYDVDIWFRPSVKKDLMILKHNIYAISDRHISDFFKICLSLSIRKSSYQRNGAWKIHRMSDHDRRSFRPDPLDIFAHVCRDNISKMYDLANAKPSSKAYPILGNTKDMSSIFARLTHILNDGKANLVITSPPYGDHKTTVAYGQFSRHIGHWLDLPKHELNNIDKDGLGGKTYDDLNDLGSPTLNKTLDRIHKNDLKLTNGSKPHRMKEAYAFFVDLDVCMQAIAQNLSTRKSHACFVVANRTVRRVIVPTDVILEEIGKKHGFRAVNKICRNIPNKAMPLKNAPENITSKVGNTMTKEVIIIARC